MAKRKELAKAATGPLAGIRILDMTSVVNGAYATQILADQGADVIKLEDPGGLRGGGGDTMRWTGETPKGAPEGLGPIFLGLNRNKRSVALDLKQESAKRALRRLIRTADVFAASVRYEGLQRLGFGYEAMAAIKPDIIYVHAAGFGSEGPYAGDPAYDDLIQSACGLGDLLSRTDGDPEPRILPTLLGDKVSGLFMAQAVTAALLHRERTGQGQFVEVPMFECVTSFTLVEHLYGATFDPPVGQIGYPRVLNPNRKPFKTRDGHIGLLPYTDKQWGQFFAAAGWADTIAKDPRFSDTFARQANIRELYALVETVTVERPTDEWLALLKPLAIPVMRANRLGEVEHDPHIEAVGLLERYAHPEIGDYRLVRPPVRFAKTPSNIRRHAPRLGEHTDEVLGEADDAQV